MNEINKHFASDNYAGVHPDIIEAIASANSGHAAAYGSDFYTAELDNVMKQHFGEQARAFPVFNGTAANVISLQSALPRWGSVICADTAHINVDEAGAPERVGGLKLLVVDGVDGKLTPELIATKAHSFGDVHKPQALAVSISQTTELGTCYTPQEVKEIADFAHSMGMILHMDGSRLSNAAAHLGLPLRDFTVDAGVDVLSLGGTKNGAMGAEAIILFNAPPIGASGMRNAVSVDHPEPIEFIRKMNLHLASKMRFLSAQLTALFSDGLWLNLATHANSMAKRLRDGLEGTGITVTRPTESNSVFVALDSKTASKAQEKFMFYQWQAIPNGLNEYRLMCSFDTSAEEVDSLIKALTA
ncbi:MAG TPA: beta-eliminating lyase-related protein [Microbacteriaceae bacterium]|nr:beta-eliminating lyase-related protein [Microbacteriaceae bacterium]